MYKPFSFNDPAFLALLFRPTDISGLKLWLDAGNTTSYSGSGSTWTNIAVESNSVSNLTLFDTPTYNTNGWFDFNGSSQYAQSSSNFTDISGNSKRTMCLWYKCEGTNSGGDLRQVLLKWGTNTNLQDNIIYQWNTATGDWLYGAQNFAGNFSPEKPTLSTWYYLTIIYDDSSDVSLYINGNFIASVCMTGSAGTDCVTDIKTASGHPLILGRFSAATARYLNGSIAQVQLWNKVLTATEVKKLYESDKKRYI